jgi:hypothetical protein
LGERGFGGLGVEAWRFDASGFDVWTVGGLDFDRRDIARSLTLRPERVPLPRRAILADRAVARSTDPARMGRRTGRSTDSR